MKMKNHVVLPLILTALANGATLEKKASFSLFAYGEGNKDFLQVASHGTPPHEEEVKEEGGESSENGAEHVGHEHSGESSEKGAEQVEHEHSGRIVVYGMGATVILLSLTFAMANTSHRLISNFTWRTLDNIISIFLAVLIFQALDEIVYDSGLIPPSHAVLGSFIYALVLLTIAVGVSQLLKGTPSNLAIFAASSAHFVSFGFMHASTLGFEHHSSHWKHAVVIFAVVLAIIGSVFVGSYHVKKKLGMTEDEELMEKCDDLENDAGAMAVSMSWTILVCYVMTNEFQDIEEEEEAGAAERRHMLYYAIAITGVAAVLVVLMSGLEQSGSYLKKRLGMFGAAVLAMCTAWAWLLWGKWYFHEHAFENAPMFSLSPLRFTCR